MIVKMVQEVGFEPTFSFPLCTLRLEDAASTPAKIFEETTFVF